MQHTTVFVDHRTDVETFDHGDFVVVRLIHGSGSRTTLHIDNPADARELEAAARHAADLLEQRRQA